MRTVKAAFWAAFSLICGLLATPLAHAQGAYPFYGAATVGHAVTINGIPGVSANGYRDAGAATGTCALAYNCGITDMPLMPLGSGALNGTFNPLAIYDNQITTGSYHSWTFGYVSGVPTMTLGASGSANPVTGINIVFSNGSTYTFPGSGNGNVLGPNPTTVSEFAIWNNGTGTLLANAANLPILHTNTFPGVANGVIDDLTDIAVGGAFPSAPELAGVHGFTATMLVPSNAPQTPHPNSAISAWIQSASVVSTNTSSVLVGGSFSTGEGTNPYGSVLTVCNCLGFGSASNTGHDFKFAVGYEADMESLTRSGGVAGTGQQWAFLAVSYSDILPAGGAIAFAVQNQGTAGGFHYGFYVNDNSAVTAALHVGQVSTGNSNSQTIEFKSTLSSVVSIGTLQYQEGSNFVFAPQSAMGVVTTTGHYGTSAGAVTISTCGTSPSGNSISNDSSGEITIGSGTVTACTVTFATAYASTPKCAFQNSAAIATGWNAKDVNHIVMTFASNAAGTTTDYWCVQ